MIIHVVLEHGYGPGSTALGAFSSPEKAVAALPDEQWVCRDGRWKAANADGSLEIRPFTLDCAL